MKLNLAAVTGVFSRLNPMSLIGKGKKEVDEDEDHHLPAEDDGDLFGDLGDLDQLDAEAKENAEGEADQDDDFADFEADFEDDFEEDDDELHEDDDDFANEDDHLDLDEVGAVSGADELDHDFEDDSLPPPPEPGDDRNLVDEIMDDLGDFDIGEAFDDEDEDDEEEAQKAKLKKLAMLAGGGVAAAVVIGGVAWWLLGGDDAPAPEDQVAGTTQAIPGEPGDLVISLDDVPPFAAETPMAPPQPTPEASSAAVPVEDGAGGLAPPQQAAQSTAPAQQPETELDPKTAELRSLGLDVQMEPGVGVVIPSVTKASFASLGMWPAAEPLLVAPVQTLVEQAEHGLLPIIGQDGTTPFDAYARPGPAQQSADPKIAVIVTGLGMSRASTEAAIAGLPADVTLSLDVYARGLDFWMKRARQAGHEVLLNLPGESADFPFSDPGPNALKTLVPPAENLKQLEWILSRTTGYFGVLSVYGSKFLTVEEQVQAVLQEIKRRGLMYVDGGAEDSQGTRVAYKVGAKWATVELMLDGQPGRKALARQLQEFEDLAKKRAVAIARISADPGSLEGLSAWLKTLPERGLQLVPVSTLANKQLIR